ncbi:MAG: YceI family protein [Flavobacteriaceae bacterium]|nr:YceI family protein [Flavobacteriaceae bacterium]
MKNSLYFYVILVFVCCTTLSINAQKKERQINTKQSKIVWNAYKIGGAHQGTIALQSGFLVYEEDRVLAGEFVVDMHSIQVTDIEGMYAKKLVNHLKSKDFFEVDSFETAKIKFLKISGGSNGMYTLISKITIKDKTITMPMSIEIKGKKVFSKLKLDRTKFGITYKSSSFFANLKDKAINDEFDLDIQLQF